jgi:hypothetical protein
LKISDHLDIGAHCFTRATIDPGKKAVNTITFNKNDNEEARLVSDGGRVIKDVVKSIAPANVVSARQKDEDFVKGLPLNPEAALKRAADAAVDHAGELLETFILASS